MPTEKTVEVLEDVATAIADAEAQLPTARELIAIMQEANEDTTDVRALMAEIEARIKHWKRVIGREGVAVEPVSPPGKK